MATSRYNPMDVIAPPKFDVGVEIMDSTVPRIAETYIQLLGKMERGEWLTEDEARMFFSSLPRCVGSLVVYAGEDADALMVYQEAITNLWSRVKEEGRFDFVDREEMIGPLRRMLNRARLATGAGIKPDLSILRDGDVDLSELGRLDQEMERLAKQHKQKGSAWATVSHSEKVKLLTGDRNG